VSDAALSDAGAGFAEVPPPRPRVPGMALLRRALAAVGIAGVVAAVLRLRGSGGTPPQAGGWRELSGPDLR
jgi:hypothetical protein